jgi:2-polyprenyl-3-methyl-5-hydroxy-6-metoxy-1,4-benzoquinol methylase
MRLYEELAQYTGRPLELVRTRCQSAIVELAWQWHSNPDHPEQFYKNTDLYLFDLTEYQQRLYRANWYIWFQEILGELKIKRILDFGGGIGESLIQAYAAGVRELDYVDIKDSKTMDYAMHRFRSHNVSVQIWDGIPRKEYDLIIAMDVLEHIPNPGQAIRRFKEAGPYLIANPEQISFDAVFLPQHISNYNLAADYQHIEGNLYQRRER